MTTPEVEAVATDGAGAGLRAAVPGAVVPGLETIVERYIAMRDKKAEMKAAFVKSTETIDAGLEKIERYFLTQMAKMGLESLPTSAGVAYKTAKTSATVADPAMFRKWIIDNESWHFSDLKANKTAIAAFKEEHDDLPPGINWREEITVNVRRK